MQETIITYETLYEIFRREKYRPELQQLDDKFFDDIRAYLKTKYGVLESQKNKISIFASTELLKTQKQLENIKRLLDDLFEKRESKIIQIASSASKLNKEPDLSIMLYQEKLLFKSLLDVFNKHKERILSSLNQSEGRNLNEDLMLAEVEHPLEENQIQENKSEDTLEEQKTEGKLIEQTVICEDGLRSKVMPSSLHIAEGEKTEGEVTERSECGLQSKVLPRKLNESLLNQEGNNIPKENSQEDQLKLIRILAPIPSFIGPGFKVYGPFESEDITNIPDVIANILVKENRAKEIKINI